MSDFDDVLKWNRDKWEGKNRTMYSTGAENQWAWYNSELDEDVAEFLGRDPTAYRDILDLGTCSGSQALGLAERGYAVVGSDVSDAALEQAEIYKARLENPDLRLEFVHDDIVRSQFGDDRFDLIFDRGCYHSICCFGHAAYVKQTKRILRPGGILLLKAMSTREIRHSGFELVGGKTVPMPFKFNADQLRELFSDEFDIIDIRDSYFYSVNADPPARARLAVLKNTK